MSKKFIQYYSAVLGVSTSVLMSLSVWQPVQASAQEHEYVNPVVALTFSDAEKRWLGDKVFQNECASKRANLTFWGAGEEFPSFGIAHFIWYPAAVKGRYHETFPDMVEYVSQFSQPPQWLRNLSPLKAPWHTKKQFDQAWSSSQLSELRDWLYETRMYQSDFVILQAKKRIHTAIQSLPSSKRASYLLLINQLMQFKKGRFAVVDYINFKGLGNDEEQYQGEQWGLLSVLKAMQESEVLSESSSNEQVLNGFVEAAKSRLQLRVKLAPSQRKEVRWLAGWFKRIEAYKRD